MNLIIYTDSSNSWFVHYGQILEEKLSRLGHEVRYFHNPSDLFPCDILFLLSCTKLLSPKYLQQNKNNIVVHASDLPQGKGFSPLQWQILEGKNKIPLTLFEAVDEVDAGPYYLKDSVRFEGHELLGELRKKMSLKIIDMCLKYVQNYKNLKGKPQIGNSTYYKKRGIADDELDITKSIADHFNHLRVADNDSYPLFFKFQGHKYSIKIFKED